MTAFVGYDVGRLLTRYAVTTPNGIDRIDLAYARHFLVDSAVPSAGIFLYGWKPALLESRTLAALLDDIEKNWRDGIPNAAATYDDVKNNLLGSVDGGQHMPAFTQAKKTRLLNRGRSLAPLRLLKPQGLQRTLFQNLPTGAAFIHTTHYPFEHLFGWLKQRQDVKVIFFIHDLLALQFPEYFSPQHIAWHRRSLELFARYGHAAIVNTREVESQLGAFLRTRGRHDVRVLVSPIPSDPSFVPHEVDADLADIAYFVTCGTIEPRKNQLMLLQLWRDLARRWGVDTPKLVLIGKRGWENENVLDLLDRSPEIRKHAIEVADLPTSAVVRVIASARALLMPSFGEGYGLPIVEARALGLPIVASDIPVFREIAPEAHFRHPLDGPGWIAAIEECTRAPRSTRRVPTDLPNARARYFSLVESFIREL